MAKVDIQAALGNLSQTFTLVSRMGIRNTGIDYSDYTHDYALELIEQLTGDRAQAQTIKESRIQMLKCVTRTWQGNTEKLTDVSIWKPLRGPLKSWPLALCDLQTLNGNDVTAFDEVHAKAVLESQQVVYNPSQKWYYLPDQQHNEIIVFKSMDSVARGEGLARPQILMIKDMD
jgi:hypothetical protein